MTAAFIVGIDLGTTNSVVAYTPVARTADDHPPIHVFNIPQVTAPGIVEDRPMLPSCVYLPGSADGSREGFRLPWSGPDDHTTDRVVGRYARNRGAELPRQLIASAKSWLCNAMIDRQAPLLPWQGPEEHRKLSPVAATAAVLEHIRRAWDHRMAASDPSLALDRQEVLVTVPASFDAVARELTVQAAAAAGLTSVSLLEEPQAAFYAWIAASGRQWRRKVAPGDLVLACDIGGGTSDFSLIQVADRDGDLALERIAVGDHLLVGGDNMDLALAHLLAGRLAQGGQRLDDWQMRALCHACRQAKERTLVAEPPERVTVTIPGRGARLIGGALTAVLGHDDVRRILLDGFLPVCERDSRPATAAAVGLREVGLAYEADPGITRHLAAFLGRRSEASQPPTKVLFNGGVTKSSLVRQRLLDLLSDWAGGPLVAELPGAAFDLAVARGAAYYGLARRGRGVRIRSGLARAYYIGVAAAMPAVPGLPAPVKALCVAPFGLEEGTRQAPTDQQFALTLGETARFELLASRRRPHDRFGDVVEDWQGDIEPVSVLETTLDGDHGATLPVRLEVIATAVGTLELWCRAADDPRRWKLEFNVREKEAA